LRIISIRALMIGWHGSGGELKSGGEAHDG
jgi:hypothetical protein